MGKSERQLAEELTATGRIEVLELARGIELRATSFVGRFRLGDITVTVHPKDFGCTAAEPAEICIWSSQSPSI